MDCTAASCSFNVATVAVNEADRSDSACRRAHRAIIGRKGGSRSNTSGLCGTRDARKRSGVSRHVSDTQDTQGVPGWNMCVWVSVWVGAKGSMKECLVLVRTCRADCAVFSWLFASRRPSLKVPV